LSEAKLTLREGRKMRINSKKSHLEITVDHWEDPSTAEGGALPNGSDYVDGITGDICIVLSITDLTNLANDGDDPNVGYELQEMLMDYLGDQLREGLNVKNVCFKATTTVTNVAFIRDDVVEVYYEVNSFDTD